MTTSEWKAFLEQFSRELLKAANLPVRPPSSARKSGWMGYRPASERAIAAAERRLKITLPPSLKAFYRVTNGWRVTSYSIYGIRPVGKIEWLKVADPDHHKLACDAETPKAGEPVHMHEYHFEQGTRVKRSLVISTDGDSATLLLDPETRDADGEWAAGMWASWSPGMTWSAPSFAKLMREEAESFLRLREDKPIDLGLGADEAKVNLSSSDERTRLTAVMALQESRDPAQAPALLRTYLDPRSGGIVREMAIRAACQLKSREAYEQAIRDLPLVVAADENGLNIDHGGDGVRPYALFSAILTFDDDPASALVQWVDAPSSRMRRMAISYLGHCRKSSLAREKLTDLLRGRDIERRESAAFALTQLMDKKTVPALVEALKDESREVRCHVLQALLHVQASEAVPAIEELARTENDPEVRDKISFVLPALKQTRAKRA